MTFLSEPAPQFHTLSNGMRVVFFPQPYLHSVGIGFYVRVGSRFENIQNMGISHFLEHVLFRGNERYPSSLEMNRAFESWGGSINGYTTREYTYFFGQLHPDHLNDAIPFMGDFVSKPLFEGVELERKIILEERLEDVDEDGQDLEVDDVSRIGIWGNDPLAHKIIGSPRTLRYIQEKHLREHFEQFYHVDNVVLCVTGAFEPEDILPLIEEAFAHFPKKEKPQNGDKEDKILFSLPKKPLTSTAFVTHDSSQVSLQLSFLGVAPDDPAFFSTLLFERILDDGMSSRLWQRIVEEKGLCYEIWASLDVYHDVSLLDIGASVAPERVVPLVESIYEELRQLRDDGPTEEEFVLARRRWSFRQEYVLDQVENLNERLGVGLLFNLYLPLQEQVKQMNAVTLDSFLNVSQSVLRADRSHLAAVGPMRKSSKRKLKELLLAF